MDVGIRDLKARLSEYLDRVEAGELIRVTDRGRPKALLTPLPGAGRLDGGIAEGWVTAPARPDRLSPFQRVRGHRTSTEVLAEDRGE